MIRVMIDSVTSKGLRAQRKAETRADILAALNRLLTRDHPSTLSMPAVSAEAGVSLRTLYRYFPTKADLVDAAARQLNSMTSADPDGKLIEFDATDMLAAMTRQFEGFDGNVAALRSQHVSDGGREIRQHRLAAARRVASTTIEEFGIELDHNDAARLADASIAVTSSSMYLELVDRMGYDSNQAASLSVWMVEALLSHAKATKNTQPQGIQPDSKHQDSETL